MRARIRSYAVVGLVIGLLVSASAEIPQVITYQGKVMDSGGTPVADGNYTMTFTVYDAASGGTSLWSSGGLTVTVSGGVFSVLLGDTGQPALSLDFASGYWVEVDVAGDILTPRVRLGSVGYAYMASGVVPGTEVSGSVTSGTAAAIRGTNTATTSTSYGLYGRSYSTAGLAVYGWASATSGTTYGGYFSSSSTDGRAVYGWASATSGTTYGGYFTSNSTAGFGVYGWASASSGTTSGVYGRSSSTAGVGVHGHASNPTGTTRGVYGQSSSFDGTGVYGVATAVAGTTRGVYGQSSSTDGTGIYGEATATTGVAYGVAGVSYSSGGRGVYGRASGTGSTVGIFGVSESTAGKGIWGHSTAPNGPTAGGYFTSQSTEGSGVFGWAAASTGDTSGGTFFNTSTEGTGVHGWASATTGTTYGVRGVVASASGYAGYFEGRGYFSGNVGIGTETPGAPLEVIGDIQNKSIAGDLRCRLWGSSTLAGAVATYGVNGTYNVRLANTTGYKNNGYLCVFDSLGAIQAGAYVDATGNGIVFGDTKSFRMANPKDPGTEIWYACIEGPEAAAYLRGTARLENGRASITFPAHFQDVAITEGMTVQLTPRSVESEGLALIRQSSEGLQVRELRDGRGNYEFDFLVMSVRKGHEDYEVIRPKEE